MPGLLQKVVAVLRTVGLGAGEPMTPFGNPCRWVALGTVAALALYHCTALSTVAASALYSCLAERMVAALALYYCLAERMVAVSALYHCRA